MTRAGLVPKPPACLTRFSQRLAALAGFRPALRAVGIIFSVNTTQPQSGPWPLWPESRRRVDQTCRLLPRADAAERQRRYSRSDHPAAIASRRVIGLNAAKISRRSAERSCAREQAGQRGLAHGERIAANGAVQLDQVEGIQDDAIAMAPIAHALEAGAAVFRPSQGRHNGDLREDQEQDAQPLRDAKQANSNPYCFNRDCIISKSDRPIRSLSH